ncbi:MAG: GAF domain-containing protein [Betaproteobacteria bacterium]|nr:GAF domain-containing protein [Betaproteobacteria bacterium]
MRHQPTAKRRANGGTAKTRPVTAAGGVKAIKNLQAPAGKSPEPGAPPARRKPADAPRAGHDRRLRFAELLLGISRKMAGMDSLDEVLTALVEVTTAELNAERGTLFLNDPETNELYSRVAQGNFQREIRLLNNSGVAGHVFTSGEGVIIDDAYADPRFNRTIDEQTGFVTKSILCVPIRTAKGEVIGVAQVLNKQKGGFTRSDLKLLVAMTTQGTLALQSAQFIERMKAIRKQELEFLDIVSEVTSDIKISSLLQKVMGEATRMLNAERSTLFLNDEKTGELWSEVGQGLEAMQIRLPNHVGIAGAVFTSGKTINIPYAYADLRFNPAFDKKTGFFTRSILCVPIVNQRGRIIGVTQVLNKHGGPFTNEDESRLKAFTAQISIALENAKLFADVQNMKNYNESMLESMSSGVLTLDDTEKIVTCNAAGMRILRVSAAEIIGRPAAGFLAGPNAWILEKLKRVTETQSPDVTMDAEMECGSEKRSVNVTVLPLVSGERKPLGSMLMVEDISSEKRMKSTMARYMDPSIADQLLAAGAEILGGQSVPATVLFSDIRGFTTLTEQLGPHATVGLLNEYFEIMVECIRREGGMLDKFIGDAIMAAFGIPVTHDDDEDRAVRAAVAMIHKLGAWNQARVSEGKPPVNIGIGLNTDVVVSGNIGSRKRMDFTIIGDGVNLAARLESACKQYHARILVSEFTFRKLRGTYRSREIDQVVVKGKTQPVAVYEILDYHTEETFPNLMDVVNQFKDGLAKYRGGKWDAAIAAFGEALRLHPGDQLSEIYIGRCEQLKANPPAGGWGGVWVMSEK